MQVNETDSVAGVHANALRVTLQSMEDYIAIKQIFRLHELSFERSLTPTTDEWENYYKLDRTLQEQIQWSRNTMTFCVLTFKNGFTVVGKSAPAAPENFNKYLAEKLAYEDAIREAWPLFGFALREARMEHSHASTL